MNNYSIRKNNFFLDTIIQTKNMFADRSFMSKTLAIALPATFQATINMLINMADTLMIGRLGESQIAAVGLGNKIFFLYILIVFGVASGTGILSAQYYGNNDIKNIRKVLGLGIFISLVVSFIFTSSTFFIPKNLMQIFTKSESTITYGMLYLSIVGFSYPATAITSLYISSVRAMGEAKLPLVSSISSLLINVTLNYILIFGHLGFEPMGVRGAAIATLIARTAEMLILLSVLKIKKHSLVSNIRDMWGYNMFLLRQFIKTSGPVILNEFFWSFGVTLYSVAYGRMGDQAVAAITIATSIQDISFVAVHGLGAATVVVLGNELGAGKLDRAKTYATYYHILTFIASMIFATLLLIFSRSLLSFYKLDLDLSSLIIKCVAVFAVFFPIRAICLVNIVGILRSGGDTFVCFLLDVSAVYFVGVPLVFLGALIWRLPIYSVYFLVQMEEVYKIVVGYIRYKQYKWLKNLNLELLNN